jgi:hypothetical protein
MTPGNLSGDQRDRLNWAVIDIAAAVAAYVEAVGQYDLAMSRGPGGGGITRTWTAMHAAGRRLDETRRALLAAWADVSGPAADVDGQGANPAAGTEENPS